MQDERTRQFIGLVQIMLKEIEAHTAKVNEILGGVRTIMHRLETGESDKVPTYTYPNNGKG